MYKIGTELAFFSELAVLLGWGLSAISIEQKDNYGSLVD